MRIENSFILIPGIGEKTERKLWKKGYTTWDELDQSDYLSQSKRDKFESFVEKAKRNLEVKNSVFFGDKLPNKELWRTYRNFEEEACFFDIETTGLDQKRNKVTTVSFHRGGETKTLVNGEDLTRENLRAEMHKSKVLVSFNGKRFDQPFLESNFDMNIQKPHIDLMYGCKRLGLSGGLKKIEKEMSIQRELEDLDGREAIRLWKEYERQGKDRSLEKLVKYNQYDAKNLQELLEKVHRQLRAQVFEPHIR